MRTTIRIDDALLNEARKHAIETGRTLTAVIQDALREVLARKEHFQPPRSFKLPAHGSGGLMPGVDLDNTSDLLDLMEGRK